MRYKIEKYNNEVYFAEDKNELFEFFDYALSKFGSRVFSDRFEVSSEKGSFQIGLKEKTIKTNLSDEDFYFYNTRISILCNALYIIKDIHGFTVDYQKLYEEYNQSRNIKPYKRRKYYNDFSTKRSRQRRKHKYLKVSKTSCKREYVETLEALSEGVKVRSKRYHLLKINHVFFYNDEYDLRTSDYNWKKQNKCKKQWQKNLK